jgi:hypothetical protein
MFANFVSVSFQGQYVSNCFVPGGVWDWRESLRFYPLRNSGSMSARERTMNVGNGPHHYPMGMGSFLLVVEG